jgi:hypothetical protein
MFGSKELVKELRTGPSSVGYVTYRDSSRSKVLGLGKVVISQNVTVEDVMLVETLSYILLSVAQLANMGFATFFDVGTVVLLWSKSLKVAFVGHVENGLMSTHASILVDSVGPPSAEVCRTAASFP